eukprot:m.200097 g.200097  ORF g.200097 m.200097 type:complete len:50 (+) comp17049_c0_seq6:2948-3097(+)
MILLKFCPSTAVYAFDFTFGSIINLRQTMPLQHRVSTSSGRLVSRQCQW